MGRLSAEEKQQFTEAASAMLAKQEKMELIGAQVREQLGGVPGRVPVRQSQAADVMAPAHNLIAILAEIRGTHPEVGAIRFRGRIFSLVEGGGRVSLSIVREEEVEAVEG